MATIAFNGVSYNVDHVVKGTDYVHGYDANYALLVSIEGIKDFSTVTITGEYMLPGACMFEKCNELRPLNNGNNNALITLGGHVIQFAPHGYGLGGQTITVGSMDLNAVTKFGVVQSSTNTPTEAMWDCMTIPYDNLFATQIAYKTNQDVVDMCVRKKQNGVWGEWEWANPPLVKNMEYRTTERWNGSPVYKQHINIGYLPNTGMKQVSFAVDGTVTAHRVHGYAKVGGRIITLPYLTNVILGVTKGRVVVTTNADYSEYYGSVIVEYTKV